MLAISASERGIVSLKFDDENDANTSASQIPVLAQCTSELEEYFDKKRKHFTVQLDWSGATDFNKKVWTALCEISHGKVMTYAQMATQIGHPKAARAVGRANGLNPIAIIVPCHRLIGTDGHLRGYAYGLERKKALLDLERNL